LKNIAKLKESGGRQWNFLPKLFFFFFCCWCIRIKFRISHLLGMRSTTWATPPVQILDIHENLFSWFPGININIRGLTAWRFLSWQISGSKHCKMRLLILLLTESTFISQISLTNISPKVTVLTELQKVLYRKKQELIVIGQVQICTYNYWQRTC
jgi:hypothetical protein